MHPTPNQPGINMSETVAEMARRIVKSEVYKSYSPEEAQPVWESISRFFEPWPDWVFRVFSEVYHVGFPTFSKETIENAFRAVHSFVFFTKLEDFDFFGFVIQAEAINRVCGQIMGHGMAHLERESQAVSKMVSSDEKLKQIEEYKLQKMRLAEAVANQLKRCPEESSAFLKALIMAEPKTFDENGAPKEFPLTPIYRKILYNWRIVESLSGPKALTDVLSQDLGSQHIEDKYERVKKICQRMQITFNPVSRDNGAPPSVPSS
jgi:hypothetical protein